MLPTLDGSLHGSGYDALDASRSYQKYMSRSLALSIVLQIVCVSAFSVFHVPENPIVHPRAAEILPYPSLIPPSLFRDNIQPSASPSRGIRGAVRPKFAVPIPVADPLVDSANTIPSQRQPWANSGTDGEGAIFGDVGDQTFRASDDGVEPPPFRPVEKEPEIVRRVEPKYPESAVRTGIEGSVILNIWVDKMGRVRKAVVLRTDAEILDSAAVEAAMQWVFTPAIMHEGPVSVWVTIPFKFKLYGN